MNKNLRALLGIRSGAVYDFYVRKAPYWKAPSYILKYHPSSSARRITVLEMLGAVSVIVAIVGVLVYFLIWY